MGLTRAVYPERNDSSIDLVRQRSPLAEAADTKVLGRVFWRRIFTIENCVRNYWKLSSTFALIDVSLTSRPS